MVIILAGLLVAGLLRLSRGHGTADANGPMHPMMALIRGLFGKKSQATGMAPPR
jgi:hypothetical protein